MRCGWEPKSPTGYAPLPDGFMPIDELDACPGYLITMPCAIETVRAHAHWERGTLRDRYNGKQLTSNILDALEVFQSSLWELEAFTVDEAKRNRGS